MARSEKARTAAADATADVLTMLACLPCDSSSLWLLCDHLWFLLYCLLLPFSTTLSRRCFARAMRLDRPKFGLSVRERIDTATINDGTSVMRGNLWLPAGQPGPFPVVLIRTPYGHNKLTEIGQGVLAERGYACLVQDTRGRFGSDGDFVPVEHERADGAATISWIRCQPWCDGRVGVFGASYLGFTAWACCGAAKPGEVQCAVVAITQVHRGVNTFVVVSLVNSLSLPVLSRRMFSPRCFLLAAGSRWSSSGCGFIWCFKYSHSKPFSPAFLSYSGLMLMDHSPAANP
ncbi:MAG: hypothetical protein SGPRY_010755 [Prymnesium sp.]